MNVASGVRPRHITGMALLTPDVEPLWIAGMITRPAGACRCTRMTTISKSSLSKAAWGSADRVGPACLSDGHLLFIRPRLRPGLTAGPDPRSGRSIPSFASGNPRCACASSSRRPSRRGSTRVVVLRGDVREARKPRGPDHRSLSDAVYPAAAGAPAARVRARRGAGLPVSGRPASRTCAAALSVFFGRIAPEIDQQNLGTALAPQLPASA